MPASLFAEEYSLDDLFRMALSQSEKLKWLRKISRFPRSESIKPALFYSPV